MDEGFNLKCGILNSVVVEKGNISFSVEKGLMVIFGFMH